MRKQFIPFSNLNSRLKRERSIVDVFFLPIWKNFLVGFGISQVFVP
jgi:hypothetical protein